MRAGRRGTDSSDEGLVHAARGGDRRALEALLDRHHDRIHLLCRRLCRDRGDAEDATQEAMVAVVRGLARFDGRSSFATWSHRVAVNACMDELRRRRRRAEPEAPEGDRPDLDPGAVDPADAVVATEAITSIQAALDLLPEEFRVAVVLRDVVGMDYAEIAATTGAAPGTVRSRIARGRRRLAEILAPDPGTADGNRRVDLDVGRGDGP